MAAVEGFNAAPGPPWVVYANRGFRAWKVDLDGDLTSLTQQYRWEPGLNRAGCAMGRKYACIPDRDHDKNPNGTAKYVHTAACPQDEPCEFPTLTCSCGFYAYHSQAYWWAGSGQVVGTTAPGSFGLGLPRINGVIEGFGRCVVGDKGFRAGLAVVVGLALPLTISTSWLQAQSLTFAQATERIVEALRARYPIVPVFDSIGDMLDALPLPGRPDGTVL